ncbi:phage protease [Chitinimonas sp.]|uniref:phage protease n=1 Tax=Chitinimonas sp. TaxID=1934313 RepID=UPI0035B2C5C3
MRAGRHFQLHSHPIAGAVRVLSGGIVTESQAEAGKQTWVTITRTGTFTDPRYGEFSITPAMLAEMVRNFDAGAYGQDIFLDVSHRPDEGAAAKVLRLSVEGNRLRALVDWTPYGIDAVKNKGYVYLSAEFHERFVDNEAGKNWGCVLLGAGLTTRPVIKRLDPVQLSQDGPASLPVYVAHDLIKSLSLEITMKWAEKLKQLRQQLAAKNLSESAINAMVKAAEDALTHITEDAAATTLCEQIAAGADAVRAATANAGSVSITLAAAPTPDVASLVADAVSKTLAQRDSEARQLAEAHAGRVKLLTDTINAASSLDEATRRTLAEETAPMVNGSMSDEQVKALATFVIDQAGKTAIARQLSQLGWGGSGSPVITVPDEGAKTLSQIYRDNLRKTGYTGPGQLILAEKVSPWVEKVLAQYDRINGRQIHDEAKYLAGNPTGMANTNLPAGFVREVIREALSDLNILQLVNTLTDFNATTTTLIPYELRDVSGVLNDGVVFEGQPINYASISQQNDSAYITPTKVAYLISNEVVYFTRSHQLNWDAMARNIETCARVLRELIHRRIANELQRSSDCYNAVTVTAEPITGLNGTSVSSYKTATFPIVRPFQARDVQGNTQGVAENPITVVLNSVPVAMYDGSNTQTPGTYYRITNYNLGYVQFVNQLGAPVFPPATGSNTITYGRATNVLKVDLDVPGGSTIEKQMNKVVQAIGAQKALLMGQRYITPDYMLMSPVLNDMVTNAEVFTAAAKRNGSDTTPGGDLAAIKSVESFGTNAPGIDLGDQRILLGQRGQLTYTVAKPFSMGEPFEAVNAQGQAIGKKQAYGEEYNAIKVPTPIRNRMTSVLAYSFTGR